MAKNDNSNNSKCLADFKDCFADSAQLWQSLIRAAITWYNPYLSGKICLFIIRSYYRAQMMHQIEEFI